MPKVTINGTEIEVDNGTSILRAAAEAGHDVPHFCYHPALSSPANCRMCLVEVEGWPKLQPACYTGVSDNMVVQTASERVVKAQKAVLEFILLNHPVDCPICDQAGECKLQDYYVDYDCQDSRQRTEKQNKVKAYPIGPEVVYDGERCILCTRCIRFCDEVSETSELTIVERGDRAEIRAFPGRDLDNAYSMCTTDICPVGALTSRDFRFKCRVWLLTSTDSVCTGCSQGCNIHLDHFRNEAQRYRPRYNPDVNDYWMCDSGRLSYKEIHEDRLTQPVINGADANWHEVAENIGAKLSRAADDGRNIAFVLSPQASCEDLYAAKVFCEQNLATEVVYWGGKPAGDSDNFLIKSDKNPNTRGVEAVWQDAVIEPFAALLADIKSGDVNVLYMMGHHVPVDEETTAEFLEAVEGVELFVLQSLAGSALAESANIVLPAASHAEKDGTFVNEDGVAQTFEQAFAAHGSALPDWQIFARIAKAMGKPFDFTSLSQIREKMFERPAPEPEPEATPEPAPAE